MKNKYFTGFSCINCKSAYGPDEDVLLCTKCHNLLEALYDYDQLKKDWATLDVKSRPNDIWRYKELMPVVDFDQIVTLGEGGVPILDCPELAAEIGIKNFYVMCDSVLPTGSLKDRTIAVTATKAKEFGYKVLTCDSSGNKAASVAAYAARAGLKSVVFVPDGTPAPKVAQAIFHGAQLVKIKSDYSGMGRMYHEIIASQRYKWYDCGTNNPFRYEGKKTYAFEILERLDGIAPDYLLHPASLGMSIVKAWKGFHEAEKLGMMKEIKYPKMVACQAETCGPVVTAINEGADHVTPVPRAATVATAISVADPELIGEETLRSVKESGGLGVHISDEDLLKMWQRLPKAGIFCEPSAAISVASAYKMAEQGRFKGDEVLVAMVTGSGFKDISRVNDYVKMPDSSVESVEELFTNLDQMCKEHNL